MKYFGIIGGDKRLVRLAEILAKENIVNIYGITPDYIVREFAENGCSNIRFSNLAECVYESDYIISGIPFSKESGYINAPLFETKISISDLIDSLDHSKIFFAGQISESIQDTLISKDVRFADLLEIEDLTVKNCILTAEGAIKIAIEESEASIHGSNVLILGYGRIGKILSHMLSGFGCNVYCEARKESELALISAFGLNEVSLTELDKYLYRFDYIFNTVPAMMLDKKRIDLIKKDALIIDLASSPGGVDYEYAKKLCKKVVVALGIPGKISPVASAKYIYETILGKIND